MLFHMYAMRAYSRGTKRRQWRGTSGLIPIRRSTWMSSISPSFSWTCRMVPSARSLSIGCCMTPIGVPFATT